MVLPGHLAQRAPDVDVDVAESLARLTLEPMIGSRADATKFLAEETGLWGKVIAEAHIRVE